MRNSEDILNDIFWNKENKDEILRRCHHQKNECSHNGSHSISKQKHTHEYEGSVKIAERQEDPHNHRFAGVTGQAIPLSNGNHFHKLEDNTDFYEDHFHMVEAKTGPAIPVGNGRHVHFVQSQTTVSEGHRHELQFATLIDNPIGE